MSQRKIKVVQMATPMLLPPHPSKCQECATDHPPTAPHNAGSLFYQVKFKMDYGRGADWRDAMAHCDELTKKLWIDALAEAGVDVPSGQVNPK